MNLREQIEGFEPYNEQERADKEIMLSLIDTYKVALKEAQEETGIENVKVLSNGIYSLEIASVDSHIKRGKYVPTHLHLNCTFLLEADENDIVKIKPDENSGVKWIDIDKAEEITKEKQMKPINQKLNEKLTKI